MTYKLTITERAEELLDHILYYIINQLRNPQAAGNLIGEIEHIYSNLVNDPRIICILRRYIIKIQKEAAKKEFQGVVDADVVIVLTPQGKGTHVELGIALALGKKVFIWHENDKYFKCTDDTSSFYWLSNVNRIYGTIEDLIRIVTAK
jgi:hypothetical protein